MRRLVVCFAVFEGESNFSAGLHWNCWRLILLVSGFCSNTEVDFHGNGSLLPDNNNVIVDFHCH